MAAQNDADSADGDREALLARIAANVRRLRADRGWTQADAARRCADMATPYLQLIERGGVNLTAGTLARLARGFGVDASELVAPAEPMPPRKPGRPPREE